MMLRAQWLLSLKARLAGLDPKDVQLSTIGPIILRGDHDPEPEELAHERIHVRQWWELLGVGYVVIFWALYVRARLQPMWAWRRYL
jgi:hypothetical protein